MPPRRCCMAFFAEPTTFLKTLSAGGQQDCPGEGGRLSQQRLLPLAFSLGDVVSVGLPGVAVAFVP
jgi:hypothetical protein